MVMVKYNIVYCEIFLMFFCAKNNLVDSFDKLSVFVVFDQSGSSSFRSCQTH